MARIFGMSSNSFHGFNTDEMLEGIAAAGFKYVDINAVRGWTEHVMPSMSGAEIDRIRKKMDSLGIQALALSGHCNLMDEARLNDFRENIKLAGRLGCHYIISSVGEAHFGKNESFADDTLAKNISALTGDLERHDLILALEVHGECGTGRSLAKVVKKAGSGRVGINYDTANVLFYGGKMPEEEIKTCAEYVKYVHLKDKIGGPRVWDFPAIGKGELKLDAFIKTLEAAGYTGPYVVEIEYTEDFTMNPKKPGDIAIARQAAKDSYDYIASHWL